MNGIKHYISQRGSTEHYHFGLHLPCTTGSKAFAPFAKEIAEVAAEAEQCGFGSLWASDHLLAPTSGYSAGWLDPFSVLSIAASATDHALLGTAVLLAPLRPGPILVKESLSLQLVSENRLVLGLGTGWYREDFEVLGISAQERGRLLDDRIVDLRDERWPRRLGIAAPVPPILVGGGSRAPGAEVESNARMPGRVLTRIVTADGWLARPFATLGQVEEDQQQIIRELKRRGRDVSRFELAHVVFCDLPWTQADEQADSDRRIAQFVGAERTVASMMECVVRGDVVSMVEDLSGRIMSGATTLILSPIVYSRDYVRKLGDVIGAVNDRIGPAIGQV